MTQLWNCLTSNQVEYNILVSFLFIYCITGLIVALTIYFSPDLQKDCFTFFTRIKNNSLLYKIAQVWFFVSFMLPTRILVLSSIVEFLAFPSIVAATILSGLPVMRTGLLAWFFLLSENITVGFFYHSSPNFKKVFDLFCGGSDMVLLFLGNTGSSALRQSIKSVQAVGVGSVGVLVEDLAANVYSFGDAYCQKINDPSIDLNKTWKATKAELNDSLPLRNVVKYLWKK